MHKKITSKFIIIGIVVISFFTECGAAARKKPDLSCASEAEDLVFQVRKVRINAWLSDASKSAELIHEINILFDKKRARADDFSPIDADVCKFLAVPGFLYTVVRAENIEVLKCLARNRIWLNTVGSLGTVLHLATREKRYDFLEKLCDLRSEVLPHSPYLIKLDVLDHNKKTAEDIAKEQEDLRAQIILRKRFKELQQELAAQGRTVDLGDLEMLHFDWTAPK
jgi:hypothetical protein